MRNFPGSSLNLYGDRLISTHGGYGADVASQRMDELDVQAMMYALENAHDSSFVCYDVGCGLGIQGIRFALLGMRSVLLDINDYSRRVHDITQLLGLACMEFIRADFRDTSIFTESKRDTILYSQRTMHYVSFDDLVTFFRKIRPFFGTKTRMFLSFSGLKSELGVGYAHCDLPIGKRFAHLSAENMIKHGIQQPVCLHDEADAYALGSAAGLNVHKIWCSAFGNVKCILSP